MESTAHPTNGHRASRNDWFVAELARGSRVARPARRLSGAASSSNARVAACLPDLSCYLLLLSVFESVFPARRSLVCCRRALLDVERDKREEGQATEPRLSVLSPIGHTIVQLIHRDASGVIPQLPNEDRP